MEDPFDYFEFDCDCWRDSFFSDLMLDEEVDCEIKFRKNPKIPKTLRQVFEFFREDEETRP
jgi:hypothetical protein